MPKPTSSQEAVIHNTDGPVLVIAGPGTGKTYTLVERIIYLLQAHKANPNEILVITFTKKAAKELLTRISIRLEEEGLNEINLSDMYISNFHSFCIRFRKEHKEFFPSLAGSRSLFDAFVQTKAISNMIHTCRKQQDDGAEEDVTDFAEVEGSREVIVDYLRDTDFHLKNIEAPRISKSQAAKAVCEFCDRLIEALVDPEALKKDSDPQVRTAGEMLDKYQAFLTENNYIVFSTLLRSVYDILKSADINSDLRNQFKYIMVDEYQDTNHVQEQITDLLSGTAKNLCVVGDDDQSIYRFRGATVSNILNFESSHPSCLKIVLNHNFRSDKKIVDFYTRWMRNPQGFQWEDGQRSYRIDKDLISEAKSETATVVRLSAHNERGQQLDWNDSVLTFIKRLKSSGKVTDYNQIAFLCSSVKTPEITKLQKHLSQNGIPIYSPRSNMFFTRLEIQQVIGCLLQMFPKTKNQISTYQGPFFQYCQDAAKTAEDLFAQHPELETFVSHIAKKSNCKLRFKPLVYRLLAYPPFSGYVDVNAAAGLEASRPSRNLSIFIKECGIFDTEWFKPCAKTHNVAKFFFQFFLKQLYGDGISEYEDEKEFAPAGHISFMTIHQSKGLEFPVVFVDSLSHSASQKVSLSLLDQILNSTASGESFLEPDQFTPYFDLWRQYYTAFSRAKNLLVLTCPDSPNKLFQSIWNTIPYISQCDFSKLPFSSVEPADVMDRFSFTDDILPYEACPQKYQFQKLFKYEYTKKDTDSTLLGTLVHQTLQDLHNKAINGQDVTPEKIKAWVTHNQESMEKSQNITIRNSIAEEACKNVQNYFDYVNKKYRPQNRWDVVKKQEWNISFRMPDEHYIITGTIDMVREYPDYVRIFDFKSGKKTPETIRDYERQLRIYAYLLSNRNDFAQKAISMQLFFTGEEENPIHNLSYDKEKENIQKEIQRFSDVVHKIQNHEFSERCSDETVCKTCDFRFFCGKADPMA